MTSAVAVEPLTPTLSPEYRGEGVIFRPCLRLFPQDFRRGRRGGFTLVEMLVAMTVTLILIFAISQTFAVIGARVAEGRATIEMAGSLRAVANRLQGDLDGLTCPVRPWIDDASGLGYFEYVEGPRSDKDWDWSGINEAYEDRNNNGTWDVLETPPPAGTHTEFGDTDDVLMFTAHTPNMPFIGAFNGNVLQSMTAEVVWWIQSEDRPDPSTGISDGVWQPEDEKLTIYRRAMLVRPDQGQVFSNTYSNDTSGYGLLKTDLVNFFNNNDISVRIRWWLDVNNKLQVTLTANSLADLTRRENRFAHLTVLSDRIATGLSLQMPTISTDVVADATYAALPYPRFPYWLDVNRRSVTSLYRSPKSDTKAGQDVMLSDALSFDVQAFDPKAGVLRSSATGDEALVPSDPSYFEKAKNGGSLKKRYLNGLLDPNGCPKPTEVIGSGAFVDLGYGYRVNTNCGDWSLFSDTPFAKSKLTGSNGYYFNHYTYCTWSMHYERDGIDQDSSGVVDQGTNGLDDDSANGVDDIGERETSPPYPFPLRGIQVKIRVYEPDTRQIRQMTVVADFTPE